MADTVTFRPKPGVREALAGVEGPRSSHINAALEAYFGLDQKPRPSARRAAAADGECSHPRADRIQLGYGTRCGKCNKMLR